jgi:hypothetical protein
MNRDTVMRDAVNRVGVLFTTGRQTPYRVTPCRVTLHRVTKYRVTLSQDFA